MDQQQGIVGFRGLNLSVIPHLLKPGELTDMENLQSVTGALALRPGLARLRELTLDTPSGYWANVIFDWPVDEPGDDEDDDDEDDGDEGGGGGGGGDGGGDTGGGGGTWGEDDDSGEDDIEIDDPEYSGAVRFVAAFAEATVDRYSSFVISCTAKTYPADTTLTTFDRYADLHMDAFRYISSGGTSQPITLLDANTGVAIDVTNASYWASGVFTAEVMLETEDQDMTDTHIGFHIHGPGTGGYCGDLSRFVNAEADLGAIEEDEPGSLNEIIDERRKVVPHLAVTSFDIATHYSVAQYKAYLNEIAPGFLSGAYSGGASVPTCFTTSYADAATTEADLAALALALDDVYLPYAQTTADSVNSGPWWLGYHEDPSSTYPWVPAEWAAMKANAISDYELVTAHSGGNPYVIIGFGQGDYRTPSWAIVEWNSGGVKYASAVPTNIRHKSKWWFEVVGPQVFDYHWKNQHGVDLSYTVASTRNAEDGSPVVYSLVKTTAWRKNATLYSGGFLTGSPSDLPSDGNWPTIPDGEVWLKYNGQTTNMGTMRLATVEWDYQYTSWDGEGV